MKKILGLLLWGLFLLSCDNSGKNDACGDNFIDVGEECDGYDLGGNYCQALGFYGGALECNDVCRLNKNDCTGYGFCGDGVIQPYNESCDGNNLSGLSCSGLGYDSGELSCTTTCRFDISNCEGAGQCGNGTADFPEQCDAGDLNGATCLSVNMGFIGGTLKCGSDCRFDFSSCYKSVTCGNGIIEGDEECDAGNYGGATCKSLGFTAGSLFCNNDCSFDTSSCDGTGFVCGNGIIEGDEECDSTDFGGVTCTGFGFTGGSLNCTVNCRIATEDCTENTEECGNGIIEGDEECDSTDFGGVTCTDFGFTGGMLSCTNSCSLDLSGCGGIVFAHLSSGAYHNCGIYSPSEIICWGDNGQGQLGMGDTSLTSSATPFVSMVDASLSLSDKISSGFGHTCVLTDSGTVLCWGYNLYGQLGDGTETNSATPLSVLGTTGFDFSDISCGGNSSCVLTDSGEIRCWGSNYRGQLGNGSTTDSTFMTTVLNFTGDAYSYVSVGNTYACALDTTGNAWCWGENNGRLGDGGVTDSATPVQVIMPQNTSFSVISAGLYHTCALDTAGNAWCWGFNSNGQIGDGMMSDVYSPTSVLMPESVSFTKIKAGAYHTCALDTTGKIWCWGNNAEGQLGDGKNESESSVPLSVTDTGVSFVAFDTGYYHICAVDENHDIWCWGQNYAYQLGITGASSVPAKIINP